MQEDMMNLKIFLTVLWTSILICISTDETRGQVTIKAVDALDLPCPVESLLVLENPEIALAVGEYESLALLIGSGKPLAEEKLEIKGMPQGMTVELREVVPYRRKLRGNKEITCPYLLELRPAVTVKEPGRAVYYLTFKANEGTVPGSYKVSLSLDGAQTSFKLKVRPFRLRRDPGHFYGAFCGGKDTDITEQNMKDLAQRGFDALQFFWGSLSVGLQNDQGTLKVDFSSVDRWMENFKKAGMRGPVVWSMGNDSRSHMENALSNLFNLPRRKQEMIEGKTLDFADIYNPELNRRLKELMLAIKEHSAASKWPEIVFLIYDEPTERLMVEHENRYKFIKSFWPELRIYGVTMDEIEWARSISHMVDIFVANGDFGPISKLAGETGKPFWLYGSASSRNQAALRHSYAWTPWAYGAQGVWFWAYNYSQGDYYDDFDGTLTESSASMVWPPRIPGGPLVFSVSWEGMREAVDDRVYLETLEWMLGKSSAPQKSRIEKELEKIKAAIPTGEFVRVLGGEAHDRVQDLEGEKYVVAYRERVAAWIEELLQAEKGVFTEIRCSK